MFDLFKLLFAGYCLILLASCSSQRSDVCTSLIELQQYKAASQACEVEFKQTQDLNVLAKWIEALAAQNALSAIETLLDSASEEPYQADALFLAASSLVALGETLKATHYYKLSADLFAKNDQFDKRAQALHQLFRIEWKKSNHRTALAYASDSLSAAQKGNDVHGEIMALKDLFTIFEEVGSLGAAQQALSLIDEKLVDDSSSGNRINAYISQGLLNMNRKRYGLAEHSFQQALTAASGSKNSSALRGLYLNIVHANIMLKRLKVAADNIEIAWSHANSDGSVQFALLFYQSLLNFHRGEYSTAYKEMQRALEDPDLPQVWVWEMHYWAGEAAHKMGDSELAIASYQLSIMASESLRQDLGADQLKAHMLSRKRDSYEALFLELFDAGRIMDAFTTSEQAKTRSFIDAFVRATEEEIEKNGVDTAFKTVSDRVDNLQTYLQRMSESSVVQDRNIEEVITNFDERTMLSYFKAKQRMFVIRVSDSEVSITELPLDHASLMALVHAYQEGLNDSLLLSRLGQALFPPEVLPDVGEHLFIAPDDFVGGIALATMRVNDKYLVESHTFSLVPSASSLVEILEVSQSHVWGEQFTVLGDPKNDLPAARNEAIHVARKLGVVGLIGDNASFANLLNNRSPEILHIASHSGNSHLGPWLRFAETDISGSTILKEKIRPHLAVLASCSSGVGQDGYFWGSLGGLFLSNGTPSTIVSLWSVEDTITQQIMGQYYAQYVKGVSVTKSLAEVQRQAIKDGVEPQKWGSYTVLGLP